MKKKIMEANKIKSAKGQLYKLADGKYHSLNWAIIEYSCGDIDITCRVYIHGYGSKSAFTWDQALQKMREKIREATNGL